MKIARHEKKVEIYCWHVRSFIAVMQIVDRFTINH